MKPVDNCISRRMFLLLGGASVATVMLSKIFPDTVFAQEGQPVRVATYPKKKIGQISKLQQDKPLEFFYPDNGPHSASLLVKLGAPAGGGVGLSKDIVAFNAMCTHQGGTLQSAYNAKYKAVGPCPIHLTTFDLTRHGMVIAGHATESLPQVLLNVFGDDIYAIGVIGLIYGYSDNTQFVKKG